MTSVGLGLVIAVYIASAVGILFVLALLLWGLAKNDLFLTIVDEGEAKAIKVNGRFNRVVMSYRDYTFRKHLPPPAKGWEDGDDDWDIVSFPPNTKTSDAWKEKLPAILRGLRWIGIPPFAEIHEYRFSWTSLEEKKKEDGKMERIPEFKEEPIRHIIVQEDAYVTALKTAECKDNIPLDAMIVVFGEITNVRKALFRVERWLEASLNLVATRMRSYFGLKTYAELRQATAGTDASTQEEIINYFRLVIDDVRIRWGFSIKRIEIFSIDPGSELAKEFIDATTKVYVAEQVKAADKLLGEGQRDRVQAFYKAISDVVGGAEMHRWEQIAKSGLSTYVEGGGRPASINVGNSSQKKPGGDTPAEQNTPQEEQKGA